MAQPLGNPKFRAFDANGDPLAGGLLYSYIAGTSTPLATYTTQSGEVANANPVVLDANGEADVWMTPGTFYRFALKNSSGVTQWTVDDFPSPAETDASTDAVATHPGGRLSLTTATPVTVSDVTGATTVFYTPDQSNKVPLYDGSAWSVHSLSSELSQTTSDTTRSPAAVTTNSNYDFFLWVSSGTLILSHGPAWSSATARGTGAGTTELERVDGRYVNKQSITNGPAARCGLYVGSVRSDASSQLNDSLAKRHVWNMYNRRMRALSVLETTVSWTYSTAAFRQLNNASTNQLDVLRGLDEDELIATTHAEVGNSTNTAGRQVRVGVGLDSTSAASGTTGGVGVKFDQTSFLTATYRGFPGLGRHFLAALEYGAGADTQTWLGQATDRKSSGIQGAMLG